MFGILVILYLFLGGCGAGVLFATSLASLLFHAKTNRSYEQTQAFDRMRAYCYMGGEVILALSALCLAADLGRPERLINLFIHPTASYLTFGTYALTACLLVGGFLALSALLFLPRVTARLRKAAEALCLLLAFSLMAYTGLLLYGMKAVAFWGTPLVPVLFVLSALSTGCAVVLFIRPFVRDAVLLEAWARRVRAVHLAIVVLEAAALGLYVLWALGDRFALPSVMLLTTGDLAVWFMGGAVACGLVLPMASEVLALAMGPSRSQVLWDVLVLVGAFALRFCIVSAGLH